MTLEADTDLSQVISLSLRYTQAEAYSKIDELMNVALHFETINGVGATQLFALHQNQPNPFIDAKNDCTLRYSC